MNNFNTFHVVSVFLASLLAFLRSVETFSMRIIHPKFTHTVSKFHRSLKFHIQMTFETWEFTFWGCYFWKKMCFHFFLAFCSGMATLNCFEYRYFLRRVILRQCNNYYIQLYSVWVTSFVLHTWQFFGKFSSMTLIFLILFAIWEFFEFLGQYSFPKIERVFAYVIKN